MAQSQEVWFVTHLKSLAVLERLTTLETLCLISGAIPNQEIKRFVAHLEPLAFSEKAGTMSALLFSFYHRFVLDTQESFVAHLEPSAMSKKPWQLP